MAFADEHLLGDRDELPALLMGTAQLGLTLWSSSTHCQSSLDGTITWELLHTVHRAKIVLESAVAVDGHTQVELRHESKERASVVAVLDGPQADTKQPVDIQHLLLREAPGCMS